LETAIFFGAALAIGRRSGPGQRRAFKLQRSRWCPPDNGGFLRITYTHGHRSPRDSAIVCL